MTSGDSRPSNFSQLPIKAGPTRRPAIAAVLNPLAGSMAPALAGAFVAGAVVARERERGITGLRREG